MSKFDKWFDSLEFDEKLTFIKSTAITVVKEKKKLNKALEAQRQHNGLYTGKGRGSSLHARVEKIATHYQDTLDMLKHSVDRL